MIVFQCPSCNKKLQAAEEHAGKSIACPACKTVAKVPPQADADGTAITTKAVEASAPPTAVTTPEHSRKAKRGEREDEDERRPRRDRDETPKRGFGVGMVLLIVGVVGVSFLCVLGILGALILPAVQKVREAAIRTNAMNNLKQIGVAAHNHHDTFRHFPSQRNQPQPPVMPGVNAPDISWRVSILPFIEQQNIWNQFDKSADWNHANNMPILSMMPKIYVCVSAGQNEQGGETNTFYQYFTGPNTMFPDPLKKVGVADIPDGLSNTILVAQANAAVPWTKAEDMVVPPGNGPLPLPNTHFPVLLGDGSVRMIRRERVTDATLRLLIDPRDGMVLPQNAFD